MDEFEEYMLYFKSLKLKDKQKLVLDELKSISYFTNKMCDNLGVENEVILNKEQEDTNTKNYTEDDFSEAIIVYLASIKKSLTDFSNELTKIDNYLDIK